MQLSAGLFGFLLLSLALPGALALTPAHYLSLPDVARLQNLLSQQFTDLESAYYSVIGLTKLGATVPDHKVRKSLISALSYSDMNDSLNPLISHPISHVFFLQFMSIMHIKANSDCWLS